MKSKIIQINGSKNKLSESFNKVDFCDVSKASTELMLERFCNGKKIEFPFSPWLGLFGYHDSLWIYIWS